MNRYNPSEIEPKWQKSWTQSELYNAKDFDDRTKYVMLTEFPYPSGDGLHLGHTREYTLGDTIARHKRMQGYNVLFPMGYDAFGLPTENFAIKNKIRPQDATERNVANFRKQFDSLGLSIDWSRSFKTTDPDYYKWTQWLFLQFLKNDMAYQADVAINWCPKCKTGLANEEVQSGVHERCDTPVEKKQLRQWMLKITKYADRLIEGLDEVDYPSRIADQQVNWIGRSKGAEVDFDVAVSDDNPRKQQCKGRVEINRGITTDAVKAVGGRVEDKDDHYMYVQFPVEKSLKYEGLVTDELEAGSWSAYIGDEIIFIFKHEDGYIERLALSEETNDQIYTLICHFTGKPDDSGDVIDILKEDEWFCKALGVDSSKNVPKITIFTTRPDTIFGATFMVLAPEHPLVEDIMTDEYRDEVDRYKKASQAKSDVERQDDDREKTGVFTGAYAINPMSHEQIPIWISDYVLMGYGTGAIMAVPAHDERDYEFASTFELPIKQVVARSFNEPLADCVNVTGVNVIGYDPDTKRFMSLWNNTSNKRWLVSGGRNDDETYQDAALRELREEAGYQEVKQLIPLGDLFYTYYYNPGKKSNRQGTGQNYIAIISEKEVAQPHNESHEDYSVSWTDYGDLLSDIQLQEGAAHWVHAVQQAQQAADAYSQGKPFTPEIFTGDGVLVNSGSFSDVPSAEARELIVQHLEREGKGKERVNYRLRDWIFSRQHYWGEPIPVIHCESCGVVPVPEKDLPVTLPDVENYEPTDTGESPLAAMKEWVNVTCPRCQSPAKRETDTMPNWAGSSWYYARYFDAHNDEVFVDAEKLNYWGMVDLYVGGMEHTTLHLLYSRFWHQFLHDIGLYPTREPYAARRGQGIVLAEDGRKMSKSLGNVVNPNDVIDSGYGADALRLCIAFIAPYDMTTPWNSKGVAGTYRYLTRLWSLVEEFSEAGKSKSEASSEELSKAKNKAIKKVSNDLDAMSFNTAVAALMEYVNELYAVKNKQGIQATDQWRDALEAGVLLTAPFAPHITEELWHALGNKASVHLSQWPSWDESALAEDNITFAVQVNGKVRAEITAAKDASQSDVEGQALAHDRVKEFLDGRKPKRIIYVPGRLINIVV